MENPRQARPAVTVRLARLSAHALAALAAGDREAAERHTGEPISDFLLGEGCRWLWRLRTDQVREEPASEDWVVRLAVSVPDGVVVGHAGFHGPPDENGMVEVGYTVDPDFRRRGYARAMLAELIRWAASDERVRVVRASISPDNAASLATIAGFGFTKTGEQWDEEDGLEAIFEVGV